MDLLTILEVIGTISFAFSGALVGVSKKMDVFGVVILGITTAVGGGVIRDILMGHIPPMVFLDPKYAAIAIIVSLIAFVICYNLGDVIDADKNKAYNIAMRVMDSIGLGVFVVAGVKNVIKSYSIINPYLAVFIGVVTGVGGGVLRDIFAGQTPYIFVKHFYACAALIGSILTVLLWPVAGEAVSMIAGASVTIVLRLLAAHFRWSLPKIK